ncbi:rCG35834 [Rattus norvegicus]|uniref:RCG35834 n=1 Tax=Rattus norvegicus TaxID=10116 RepID=A6IKJ4_RAT|nr:rCG35834 [Rattus norvegicus]
MFSSTGSMICSYTVILDVQKKKYLKKTQQEGGHLQAKGRFRRNHLSLGFRFLASRTVRK